MNQKIEQSEDDKFLFIKRDRPAGFFSNYFFALEGILEALDKKLIPVIAFPMQRKRPRLSRYISEERWADYFDVREEPNPGRYLHTDHHIYSQPGNRLIGLGVEEVQSVADANLQLKSHIRYEFDNVGKHLLGTSHRNILGVHFRGGDMHWHPSHPTPLLQRQFVAVIKEALSTDEFNQIFVATDTPSFVRRLRRSVDVPVSSVPLVGSEVFSNSKHSVKRVLLDAYLLSKCGGFVHTQSNVSLAASVFRGSSFYVKYEASLGSNPSRLPLAIWKLIVRGLTPEFLSKETPTVMVHRRAH